MPDGVKSVNRKYLVMTDRAHAYFADFFEADKWANEFLRTNDQVEIYEWINDEWSHIQTTGRMRGANSSEASPS